MQLILQSAAYVSREAGLVGLAKNAAAAYNKTGIDAEGFELTMKANAVEPNISDVSGVAKTVLFYTGEYACITNEAVTTVDGGRPVF